MRFHPEQDDDDQPRRPPNYFSRPVQYRLILLVSMFMLVLVLMDRVRDPKMWQWMWAGQYGPDAEVEDTASENPAVEDTGPVNTQLPPPGPDAVPTLPDAISTAPRPLGELPDDGSPAQRARDDMWAHLLQSLSLPEQSTLDRALKRHRDGEPLEAEQRDQWAAVLTRLQSRAEAYFRDARRATEHATLAEQQQQAWLDLVDRQQKRWEQQTLDALGTLGEADTQRSDEVSQELEEAQQSLDRLAMANIKDNTVMRSDESRAWFRMFERLAKAPAESLRPEQSQRVGFLQLFRQPDIFRGQLVTIHGTIELAYRLKAPENAFDIDSYYILWIRPAAGPSNPVVVYSLDLPDGFPQVVDRDQPGQAAASTDLSEEVDVTGYYFKNWAYRSREGINTAPLMLARSPDWTPPAPVVEPRAPLTWRTAAISVGGMGLLAAVLAVLAFRSSTLPKRTESDHRGSLESLEKLKVVTPQERLQEMSRREQEKGT